MPVFIILLLLILLAGGVLYCMKPNQDNLRKARFKSFEHHYIADMGLYDDRFDAPENTMAAFRRAISCGFGIKIDVKITNDKKVIAFRDDNIKRLCGVNVTVSGTKYDELKGYKIKDTEERIPLLSSVLSEAAGRVPVIVEIGRDTDIDRLCRIVWEEMKDYEGDIAVMSPVPEVVAWFRTNCGEVLRGQKAENKFSPRYKGSDSLPQKAADTLMLTNFKTLPDFVAYDFMEFDGIVMRIMRSVFGVETVGWTMTSQKCIDDLSSKFDIIAFAGFTPKEKENMLY